MYYWLHRILLIQSKFTCSKCSVVASPLTDAFSEALTLHNMKFILLHYTIFWKLIVNSITALILDVYWAYIIRESIKQIRSKEKKSTSDTNCIWRWLFVFACCLFDTFANNICSVHIQCHCYCNMSIHSKETWWLQYSFVKSRIIIANRPRANDKSSDSNYVVENFFVFDSASTNDDDNATGPDTGNENDNISPKVRNTFAKSAF